MYCRVMMNVDVRFAIENANNFNVFGIKAFKQKTQLIFNKISWV